MDIQAFVQHQERDRKPFLMNDPEVDGLVSVEKLWILDFQVLFSICLERLIINWDFLMG